MLKNLAFPILHTLKDKTIPPVSMIYSTEMISHIERLLYEAYTGDPKGYDIAYWRHIGVVDAIAHRGSHIVDSRQQRVPLSTSEKNRSISQIGLVTEIAN